MKQVLTIICAALAPLTAFAEGPAQGPSAFEIWQADPATVLTAPMVDLDAFLWQARAIVVFADTPADPRFGQQMDLLLARMDELVERDVVLITDTSPADRSELRTKLRPRGFSLVVMAKDGSVALRKPFPWDVREISRAIDKFPLRQQELRDRRLTPES